MFEVQLLKVPVIERYFPSCFMDAIESVCKYSFNIPDISRTYGIYKFFYQNPQKEIEFKNNGVELDIFLGTEYFSKEEYLKRLKHYYGIEVSPRLVISTQELIEQHDLVTSSDIKTVSLGLRNLLIDYDRNFLDKNVLIENFSILEQMAFLKDERTAIFDHIEKNNPKLNETWYLLFSHNFCINKSFFQKVGGFDVQFSKYWGAEDVELGYRIAQFGGKIVINKNSICYHLYYPVGIIRNITQLRFNLELFFKKHPDDLVIDAKTTEDFLRKHDWKNVAERFQKVAW